MCLQLLPADSVAVKVMKLAEEKRAFFWVGRVSSGGFAAFALSAFFFIDASTVVRCINLTTGTFAGCAVSLRSFQRVYVILPLTHAALQE